MNQLSHSFANRILPAIFLIFLSSGILAQTQTFSSSGTFTVPAGVTSITVQAWGGGGGGGQSAGNRARGGGGGGAFTGGTLSVSPGDVLTITVGGGGPAGSNGGNSSVGAIVANGGFADNSGPGGLGGAASAIALPVTASIAGGTGGDGYTAANNGGGGGGGSAASSSLPGTVGTAGNSGGTGGAGGNSPLTNPQGDGGRGADNDGSPGAGNGTAPGGGGGGQSDDDEDGGDGANGQVILTWTCSDNINNMSTTATTPVCTNGTSTVTVTSTSLADGTYTVYYNLSGANTATAQSASMTFSGVTGTFATIPFVNSGATTITITSVGCANVVTGQDFTAAVTVNGAPATPGAISGTTPVCSDQTGLIYSISAVSGATSYNWTVPTGWSITAGSGTISITVTSGSADQSGTIAVTATNTCGTSAASSLAVDLIDNIGFNGNTSTNTLSICEGTTGTTINGAGAPSSPTYNWQVSTTSPSSGFSTASNGTNNDEDYTVDNDYYDNPGTYYFRRVISSSTTACNGNSDVVTLTVNANPAPVISVDESSGTPDNGTICNGASVTLDAGLFNSYNWSPGGATSQTINVSPSSTTTYSVTVTNAAGCSGTDNQVITVNPVPVINSISATPPSISCGGSSVLTVVPANNATQTFAQNTTITIPNFGNASPFPSTISVSGLPTSGVSLQNVVFNNLSHEDPDDMDIYLIGPNNQVIWIMSDAGGGGNINNFDLTFEDGGTALSTSTFGQQYNLCAGRSDEEAEPPGGATLISSLSGFSGNMNGTWSLYIVDDSNDSNSGDLEDWFLTFTYADYTYAWSNGPTTSSQTVMPTATTTYTVTVTTPGTGCSSTANVTVTVTDTEPPMISCPSNISVNNDPGQCCAVVNYTAPVGTDNCTGQTTAQTAGSASGFCFPVGVTTNTFVVTAANSQTATCSFTVTVTDNEPPAIACPSNVSVNNDPGQCCAVVNYTAPVGTDNCPGQSTAQTAGQASGFCFPVGVTTNTFVVTAANSQTATCSFTVTVTDNQPPMISCPSNVSVNNDPGQCGVVTTRPSRHGQLPGQRRPKAASQGSASGGDDQYW
ncbi:MAG: HYR domain-containing protein [Saprospirales bacterium]|nr:HYR domain-containing protein [Saprospirales bacterium]